MAVECAAGLRLEVQEHAESWYEATLIEVGQGERENQLKIRLDGWASAREEWIAKTSKRLRLSGAQHGRIRWAATNASAAANIPSRELGLRPTSGHLDASGHDYSSQPQSRKRQYVSQGDDPYQSKAHRGDPSPDEARRICAGTTGADGNANGNPRDGSRIGQQQGGSQCSKAGDHFNFMAEETDINSVIENQPQMSGENESKTGEIAPGNVHEEEVVMNPSDGAWNPDLSSCSQDSQPTNMIAAAPHSRFNATNCSAQSPAAPAIAADTSNGCIPCWGPSCAIGSRASAAADTRANHDAHLTKNCIGREEQKRLLLELLCGPPGPAIFLHGAPATGKSLVLLDVLSSIDKPRRHTIMVDCIGCFNQRLLLESIVNQLPAPSKGAAAPTAKSNTGWVRCERGLPQLVEALRDRCCRGNGQRLTLVFDRAERLRDMDSNLLAALLRINELMELSDQPHGLSRLARPEISAVQSGADVVLVSENNWATFRDTKSGTGVIEPLIIHFPAYSKPALLQILQNDEIHIAQMNQDRSQCSTEQAAVTEVPEREFIALLLDLFYPVCRDLLELRRLLRLLMPKLHDAFRIHSTSCPAECIWQIRHAIPLIEDALKFHFYTSSTYQENVHPGPEGARTARPTAVGTDAVFELPLFSKYLLIAAYLASHVSAKHDKLLFTELGMRKRRKAAARNAMDEAAAHRQPHSFSLERLLAIFRFLYARNSSAVQTYAERRSVAEDAADDADLRGVEVLVQVTTLVQLRLLVMATPKLSELRIGALFAVHFAAPQLRPATTMVLVVVDGCKYKCNCDYGTIEGIAGKLNPPLGLADFFDDAR